MPAQINGQRRATVYHVVLVVTPDGTRRVLGTGEGKPFRSGDAAREVADFYAEIDGTDVTVLLLESSED